MPRTKQADPRLEELVEQLRVEFNSLTPFLEDVAAKYLKLGKGQALRKAGLATLPFPAFRDGGSKRAPYIVYVRDLAKWMMASRDEAAEMHRKVAS